MNSQCPPTEPRAGYRPRITDIQDARAAKIAAITARREAQRALICNQNRGRVDTDIIMAEPQTEPEPVTRYTRQLATGINIEQYDRPSSLVRACLQPIYSDNNIIEEIDGIPPTENEDITNDTAVCDMDNQEEFNGYENEGGSDGNCMPTPHIDTQEFNGYEEGEEDCECGEEEEEEEPEQEEFNGYEDEEEDCECGEEEEEEPEQEEFNGYEDEGERGADCPCTEEPEQTPMSTDECEPDTQTTDTQAATTGSCDDMSCYDACVRLQEIMTGRGCPGVITCARD